MPAHFGCEKKCLVCAGIVVNTLREWQWKTPRQLNKAWHFSGTFQGIFRIVRIIFSLESDVNTSGQVRPAELPS